MPAITDNGNMIIDVDFCGPSSPRTRISLESWRAAYLNGRTNDGACGGK